MQNLLCPIAKNALENPNACAIEEPSLSYAQLEEKVQQTQHYLRELLLGRYHVGVVASPSLSTILLYFAALREGLSVCMLNPKMPQQALENAIDALHLRVISAPSALPQKKERCNTTIAEEHTCTYLFTSGSSAHPKIAALSLKNHYYSALGMLSALGLTSSSRYLLSLPLHHVSGLSILYRTWMSGATLVLPKEDSFTPHRLTEDRISHLSLVSTQFIRLLEQEAPLPHLRSLLLGGSFIPQNHLEKGIERKLPLYLSYGLTEMASTVCLQNLQTGHFSCGSLLPYRELQVSKEGEIFVQGETLFKGYYDTISQEIIPHKGWFATRDIGTYHPLQGLTLQGRKDRLMISGGENIQPEEIENHIKNLPDVKQAVILSLPDPLFGEKMVAIVAGNVSFSTLSSTLSTQLPPYKVPRHYLPWPSFQESSQKISAEIRQKLRLYALKHERLQ